MVGTVIDWAAAVQSQSERKKKSTHAGQSYFNVGCRKAGFGFEIYRKKSDRDAHLIP